MRYLISLFALNLRQNIERMDADPEKTKLSGLVKQKPLDFWPMKEQEPLLLKWLKYAVNYTVYGFVFFIACIVLLVTLLVI